MGFIPIRTVLVAFAVVASVTVTSCSDGPKSSVVADTAERGASPAAAQLDEFAKAQPGFQLRSDAVSIAEVPTAVIGTEPGPQDRSIIVATYNGAEWSVAARIALPPPTFPFSVDEPRVEVGDVTGDGAVEFLVPLVAQGPVGTVVSADGGTWHALPIAATDGSGAEPYVGLEPHIGDGKLTSLLRSCDPDCASGSSSRVAWSFEEGTLTPR